MLELLEDGAFNVNRAITMMLIAFIHDRLRAGGSGSQAAGGILGLAPCVGGASRRSPRHGLKNPSTSYAEAEWNEQALQHNSWDQDARVRATHPAAIKCVPWPCFPSTSVPIPNVNRLSKPTRPRVTTRAAGVTHRGCIL